MTWNGDVDDLRMGASNPEDQDLYGISEQEAARLADRILSSPTAPSSTPLPRSRGGLPQGYADPRRG
jgi:hypothetical protein